MMADYISRESAVKVLTSIGMQVSDSRRRAVAKCINEIALLHAANVEPVRHGRWEQCYEDWRQQIEGDMCSVCGFEYYGTGSSRFHYCPNCGAKMDGGAEDD